VIRARGADPCLDVDPGVDPGLDPLLVRNALEQSGVPVTDGDWTGTMLDAYTALALVRGP